MKNSTKSLLAGLLLTIVCGAAHAATTDDVKWINQCVQDNKSEGASQNVVLKYCTCMNNKMSENDTLSITAWEKTHPAERKACDVESGWR